jgi:hypothetical protein
LTVTVNAPSVTMTPAVVLPGGSASAESDVTVNTNTPTGYRLTATDASDTASMVGPGAASLADWTGTDATPTPWPGGAPGVGGMTLLSTTGSCAKPAKWGTGTTPDDTINNRYAGLTTAPVELCQLGSMPAGSDVFHVSFRATSSMSQAPGSYSATITYTAVANP